MGSYTILAYENYHVSCVSSTLECIFPTSQPHLHAASDPVSLNKKEIKNKMVGKWQTNARRQPDTKIRSLHQTSTRAPKLLSADSPEASLCAY
ncbi:hypothetical protein NPIL_416611 [Nephila pilipes]|uniref:Uncharacterized protein n=1 Tax=Nephila pilipes TaxID=299642 RepID=A0A8X6P0R1_NEPPI|nr:hypothetical protein NPIL_416611 [Nephila pilipes]